LSGGADDVSSEEDGSIEVITSPTNFTAVRQAFADAGLVPELAEVTFKPTTETELLSEDGEKMQKLIDALENLDDVQDVYTTAVFGLNDEST